MRLLFGLFGPNMHWRQWILAGRDRRQDSGFVVGTEFTRDASYHQKRRQPAASSQTSSEAMNSHSEATDLDAIDVDPFDEVYEILTAPINEERPWMVFGACRDANPDLFFSPNTLSSISANQ